MPQYRVAVIGHTGRGNFGHGIDRVWLDVPECKIVAVADSDDKGLAAAAKRLAQDGAAPVTFADYREMLSKARADIVAVCPRHLDHY